MSPKRFRIAFSFTGEKREFVAKVAALLAAQFGEDRILYDKYHEAEFARFDLGIRLPILYGEESDLIVPVLCPSYDKKRWTGWEWVHIYSLLTQDDGHRVMPSRFNHATVPGLSAASGFIELDDKTPEQFAKLILERLALNEKAPRENPAPTTAAPPSNLPGGYIGQLFLGREDFLKELRASLLKQTHATAITQAQRPAATVTEGLGGLGKTHAAVEYAHRHRGDYAALLFVSGDSPQRLQSGLAALCEVPGLLPEGDLPPEETARARIALHWLATHPGWLLIVDNVDDEASALALREHFEQLRTGHVLITSRLHQWPQQVDSLDLSVLSQEDATALLLQLTDKGRRKAADDTAQAHTLAALMEGLPLALHQAAGYINEQRLSFAQCLAIYQAEAAELLNWFNGLSIPYERPDKLAPRPVLITWKTSFDQLAEETRFWLLVCSHFAPEPIPEFLLDAKPDAAEAVKTRHRAAQKALAQADKFNLLTRYDDPPRFKLHRLVQEVTRLSASAQERTTALAMGIQLMDEGYPGDPQDVRTWAQWTPLQPHALALCLHAPDEPAPEGLTWLLGCLSLLLKTKSLYAQAEPLIRRALQIDQDSYGAEHPDVAIRLNNLATLLQATNRLAEAEPLMRRALQIDEASYGPEHPDVAIDLNNLAQLLQARNRLAEAEPLMRRALQIDEASYGPEHPNVAIRLNNLAQLLKVTNRLAEAEPLMRRALQIDEASFGAEHPKVAIRLNNLAQLLQATNRLAEAEPLMRRALEIDEASYGPEHPMVAIRLNNLAQLLKDTNRLAEAEPLMRRALQIDEASYGPEHPNVAIRLNNLAQLLQATNRLAEAEPLMRRALQIDEASYGPEHPMVAIRLNNLAQLLKVTNRLAEAEPLMARVVTIFEAAYGKNHPNVATALNNLARLLQDTNRLAEAEPLMRRALGIFVRSLALEHPYSQGVRGNYTRLLQALELPQAEIQQRVAAAMGGE
ncbi:MAG: hypothetical protein B7Z37_19280 [Verrucomicrobia bacterium 12-59-8]|nr:MAG: hypothetical protein B7Z37_19280 [Verrucomicrobia bacterium 12-59-8]